MAKGGDSGPQDGGPYPPPEAWAPRIAMPLVRPALAALCIFTFLGNWNAFLWPLIVVQTPEMRTPPVGIALFSGEAGSSWHLIMAASALAVLPVLAVFIAT
jgi:multiple sugar transport system permease protein